MAHQRQLENKKYRNWVKAGLGLKYVQSGLEPFTEEIIRQQHTEILNTVKQKYNLSNVVCGQCTLSSLQPNHIQDKSRRCPFRQKVCNCQYPSGKSTCPNNVCSAIYDEIISLHGSTPPSPFWRNTEVELWCKEPWSIAKCFINCSGYSEKKSPNEFDCSALLHIIINNKGFDSHIRCDIDGKDIFSKLRDARNSIIHSTSMELEDDVVDHYIENMIAVLQDGKELISRVEAQEAVKNLIEIKSEAFIMTTKSEAEVVGAALAAVMQKEQEFEQSVTNAKDEISHKKKEHSDDLERQVKEAKQKLETKWSEIEQKLKQTENDIESDFKRKLKDGCDQIEQVCVEAKKDVQTEKTNAVNDVEQHRQQATSDISQQKKNALGNIEEKLKQAGDRAMNDLDQKLYDVAGHIEKKGNDVSAELELKYVSKLENEITEQGTKIGKIEADVSKIEADVKQIKGTRALHEEQIEFVQLKEGFKKRLVSLYKEYAVPVSVVPLQPEAIHASIRNVYVDPWITITQLRGEQKREVEGKHSSIRDVFEKDAKGSKLIYILGEAGSGKTGFCKHLIHHWCSAHSADVIDKGTKDDVDYMKMYDFLFYISLRHNTEFDDIKSMLINQYEDPLLETILQNESEKCLIVLDGLDEWKLRSQQKSVSQFQTKGIPIRGLDKSYTIVTTSRPSRVESLRLKDNEVHKQFKLHGISSRKIYYLAYKIILSLNKRYNKERIPNDFIHDLDKCPLSELQHLPVILQQLVCIWFENGSLGKSRCDVYMRMLDLYFGWTGQKTDDDSVQGMLRYKSSFLQGIDFSGIFRTFLNQSFEQYKYVVYFVALLAFETLFSRNKAQCLTFDIQTITELDIPEEILNICVTVGLITEERNLRLGLDKKRQSTYSFVHKTMQECLAAIYIAMKFQMSVSEKQSSADSQSEVLMEGRRCINIHFEHKTSVDEIFELSNVIVMLCGFEPLLATHLSKHIYQVASCDLSVQQYRQSFMTLPAFIVLPRDKNLAPRIIVDLQNLILTCIKEIKQQKKQLIKLNYLYLGDLDCKFVDEHDFILLECIQESIVTLDVGTLSAANDYSSSQRKALSLFVKGDVDKDYQLTLLYMDAIKRKYDTMVSAITKLLEENCSTITCISMELDFFGNYERQLSETLSKRLPDMKQLRSIQLHGITFSEEQFNAIESFFEKATYLQVVEFMDNKLKCSDEEAKPCKKIRRAVEYVFPPFPAII